MNNINDIEVIDPQILNTMNTESIEKPETIEELEAKLAKAKEAKRKEKEQKRKDYEALKDDTIQRLGSAAVVLQNGLMNFKKTCFEDSAALYEMLQEYSSRHADAKGNFKVENDNYRLNYKRQGKATFDERSLQAEKHIIDFVNNKYNGDEDTCELIMSLLERKKGELDINLVQKLYAMEDRFDDENWRLGISLLKESYKYAHSKDYINFEVKDKANNEWKPIVLQFSAL